ncbi:hypothetical protein GCM10010533_25530 [Mycolicibacterium pallens]
MEIPISPVGPVTATRSAMEVAVPCWGWAETAVRCGLTSPQTPNLWRVKLQIVPDDDVLIPVRDLTGDRDERELWRAFGEDPPVRHEGSPVDRVDRRPVLSVSWFNTVFSG